MLALKRARWLLLLGGFGCKGPTLEVGHYLPLDAGQTERDAGGTGEEDAFVPQDARVVARDAQADGRISEWIPVACWDDDDCIDPRWARCNTKYLVCTNCQYDRDCMQGEYCDMSPHVWHCRPDDGHHGTDTGPGSTEAVP